MSSMSSLIEVARMDELSTATRARVIIRLGNAINNELCGNFTEALVFELVQMLEPTNPILTDESFLQRASL